MALSWPAHGAMGLLLAVALLACLASALVVALCLAAGRADDDATTSAAAAAGERPARPVAAPAPAPLPDDELARAARTALRARRAWAFDASRRLTGRAGVEDLPDAAEALARRGAALALRGGAPIVLPGDERSALVSVPHRGGALVVAAAPTIAARPTTVRLLRELAAGDAARRAPSIAVGERLGAPVKPVAHRG